MSNNYYFKEIDIIKGIAILTVILEHSFAVKYINLTEIEWCSNVVEVIKSFNMQLFFVISGFLFANSKQYNWCKAYKGKFDRLLVPMLFLAMLSLAMTLLFPQFVDNKISSFRTLFIEWFLFGECYWFVYTLLVIFFLVIPLKKYLTVCKLLTVCILLIVLKENDMTNIRLFQLHHVLYMLTFFLSGFLLYTYYIEIRAFLSKYYVIISGLVLYVILYQLKGVSYVNNWVLPLVLGVSCIGIGIRISDNYESNILKYFGRNSLQFYLFNGFALVPARLICIRFLKIFNPLALVFSVFLICLFLLYLYTELSRRIPIVSYLCGFGRKGWVKS